VTSAQSFGVVEAARSNVFFVEGIWPSLPFLKHSAPEEILRKRNQPGSIEGVKAKIETWSSDGEQLILPSEVGIGARA
jgi:hypothetical protein